MLWLVPQASVAAAILRELSVTTGIFKNIGLAIHNVLSAPLWKIRQSTFVWQSI